MQGKTCVITGANSGLGLASAKAIAAEGARVVMACRSLERAEAAAAEVRAHVPAAELELVRLDLADLAQVRDAVAELLDRCPQIDVLMNNAGLTVPERRETKDGFELHVGVNHLGPFLLTRLLLPRLRASAPSRIVIVAPSSRSTLSARTTTARSPNRCRTSSSAASAIGMQVSS